MSDPTIYQKIKRAVDFVQTRAEKKPAVGLILGSGLGTVAADIQSPVEIPYGEIPHFHETSVQGHAGKMALGDFHGVPLVCLQGRFHRYEGIEMEEVVFPTRVICALGIRTLVLTNAAGGINTRFHPRDLMVIEDHINLMGDNPLRGPNLKELGPRFPDLTEAYHAGCIETLEASAQEQQIPLRKGIYAGVLGPTYETPAEIRMLRTMGADAVGMSTVPESIAANHLGVRVAAISCITNQAAGISPTRLTHDEVIENSRVAADNMGKLLAHALPQMA